ncbi:IS66 family insertion sequence element accessory protein TnpB (plasmid) [Shinella yambaruensis]|uniref:IS66 family insertion sequence element accessory protein TnpB n=1 Tax=Shinella TaxID=323620 RepID=UPI00258EFEAC|nr:IS66 family insertion sequence element accessory protein TnpB [Shinella sp.]MCW5712427.1 IS66 family insertion sequence element accessory protein TnpB [Shinella sp.]
MIASGVVVYVSAQPVGFRKGAASLMALASGLDPFSGALYVFRSKRTDRIRIVWWDGSGVCLYAKVLEGNSFCWPGISAARLRLDHSHSWRFWQVSIERGSDPRGSNARS